MPQGNKKNTKSTPHISYTAHFMTQYDDYTPNLPQGAILQNGKYTIDTILGQGGFGITYKARQSGLNREVAIKEFYMNKICTRESNGKDVSLSSYESSDLWNNFKIKFLKEARTIASLSHPNIVKIIEVFEENNTAYYAMEYIPNGSLKKLVQEQGVFDEADTLHTIKEVGNALEYIHSRNILHLDIKPDNIMLSDDKNPIIIDFGISKHYNDSGTQTSMMQTGRSKGYAPIEQYKQGGLASFTPATDVYSLAATLYFLLQGERPPEPKEIYDDGLPIIIKASAQTMEAILKGMSIKRAERPQSIKQFLELLHIKQSSNASAFDASTIRSLIKTLEDDHNYKEAYNRCLKNIENGNDVEFSQAKASELITKMRKNNNIHSIISVIIAIIVSILVVVISLQI